MKKKESELNRDGVLFIILMCLALVVLVVPMVILGNSLWVAIPSIGACLLIALWMIRAMKTGPLGLSDHLRLPEEENED